jgi:hypothetical protein
MAPLRGALLAYPRTQFPFQTTNAGVGFQATRLDADQLQTTADSLVPNWLQKWYLRRLLPTTGRLTRNKSIFNRGKCVAFVVHG